MYNKIIHKIADSVYNPDIVRVDTSKILNIKRSVSTKIVSKDQKEVNHVRALIEASIQFNFWYGTSNFRPNNVDSLWLNNMFDNIFEKIDLYDIYDTKELVIFSLMNSGITYLEKRIEYIEEVYLFLKKHILTYAFYNNDPIMSLKMIKSIPLFSDDLFLKKGLYAIHKSTRLNNLSNSLPVPADYQIPKILRHFGVLEYKDSLCEKIEDDVILLQGSKEEVSIRSATILACSKLAEENSITPQEVDTWLFKQKSQIKDKHHLCNTTWY